MTTPNGADGDTLRFAAGLGVAFVAVMAAAGIDPVDRAVWATENVLPVFVVGWLAVTARSFPLSRLSYASIFGFMCLHQIGAHYTYPGVPYEAAWRALSGAGVVGQDGAGRNGFDRFAHFAFGLAFALPLREVVLRLAGVSAGFWSYGLAFSLVLTSGLLYEFFEWAIALRLGDARSEAFLGAQGDQWDAHQDMLAAGVGAALALAAAAAVRATLRRGYARA